MDFKYLKKESNPLLLMIKAEIYDLIKCFSKNIINDSCNYLELASKNNDVPCRFIKKLIKIGVDIQADAPILKNFIKHQNYRVVTYLLDKGRQVNQETGLLS